MNSNSSEIENVVPKDLLPHSGQMVFIEKLLFSNYVDLIRCKVIAKSDHIGKEVGSKICPSVSVEYIAQSSAILAGIIKKEAKKGLLISVRNFKSQTSSFSHLQELEVEAFLVGESANTSIFGGTVSDMNNKEKLVECRISILELK